MAKTKGSERSSKGKRDKAEPRSEQQPAPIKDTELVDPGTTEVGAEDAFDEEFEKALEDITTLEEHFQEIRPEVGKLTELPDILPSVRDEVVIRYLLRLYARLLEANKKLILDSVGKERRKRLELAFERFRGLCYALLYADEMYQIHADDPKVLLRKRSDEAAALLVAGKHALKLLENMGRVSPEEAARIRGSKKKMDKARDLISLGRHIGLAWHLLARLQPEQPDPALRLTESMVLRMPKVGAWLVKVYGGEIVVQPKGTDWRRQVIGIYHLLEEDYFLFREAGSFFYRWDKRYDEAAGLVALRGLYKLAGTTKKPKKPKEAEEAEDLRKYDELLEPVEPEDSSEPEEPEETKAPADPAKARSETSESK